MKFADDIKSKIIGIGNVGKNDSDLITNVMLVEGLTHNFLSINQFCDHGYRVVFEPSQYVIKDSTSDKIILTARRHDNTYVLYLYVECKMLGILLWMRCGCGVRTLVMLI